MRLIPQKGRRMSTKPLDGIRVIDMSTHVAAPSTGRLLSYLGAEVIKLESLSGEPYRNIDDYYFKFDKNESPLFDILNGGKKSISVNMKDPEVLPYIYKLVETSDIFLSNVRAASLEKLGLGYEKLSSINPRLVYGHFSGYGEKGADANRAGYDSTAFLTRSGFYRDMVDPDSEPITHCPGLGDITCGLAFTVGLLGALMTAQKTGVGDKVTSALNATSAWTFLMPIVYEQYGPHYNRPEASPLNAFEINCRGCDGEWVHICAFSPKQWAGLCNTLGCQDILEDPQFATLDSRSGNNAKYLYNRFQEKVANYTAAECENLLMSNDVPCERHYHFKDQPSDPQLLANDFIVFKDYPSRRVGVPEPPFKFANYKPETAPRGPRQGENSKELFREAGCSEEMLAALIAKGSLIAE